MSRLDDGGGGGSGSHSGIYEYINPNASSLLDKVDFVGMVRDSIRTIVFLISLSWAAFVVGIGRAFQTVTGAIMDGYVAVYTELVTGPAQAQRAAAETASGELSVFGIFALPAGATIAIGALFAAAGVIYIFTGGELV